MKASNKQIVFWKGVLVPKFRDVFRENGELLTLNETDMYLKYLSPLFHIEEWDGDKFKTVDYKSLKDISKDDLKDSIEWIKYLLNQLNHEI